MDFSDTVEGLRSILFETGAAAGDRVGKRTLADHVDRYRTEYIPAMRNFFSSVLPVCSEEVVYPFCGGDSASVLLAFPAARTVTMLSLEQVGDPLAYWDLNSAEREMELQHAIRFLGGTLEVGSNTSENLSAGQRLNIPFQLCSLVTGLIVHGCEILSVRFFTLNEDGSMRYYTRDEIVSLKREAPTALVASWDTPAAARCFSNAELTYLSAAGETRCLRHIAANLQNERFHEDTPLYRHLAGKHSVDSLIKGASYLLWDETHTNLSEFLLMTSQVILSDSTGIPLARALSANRKVETYGRFDGAFLNRANKYHESEMVEFWRSRAHSPMPHRFGYVDCNNHPHLMIQRHGGSVS